MIQLYKYATNKYGVIFKLKLIIIKVGLSIYVTHVIQH